jgi:hypothetical protein
MNVSRIMRDNMIKKLSGETEESIPLEQMKLRARFNSHRHPEIWTFNAVDDIDQPTLEQWADDAPQAFADWVRANGTAMYTTSDYFKTKNRKNRIV